MLRQSIARKIIRVRSARSSIRSLHDYEQTFYHREPEPPLPPLSIQNIPESSRPPIYPLYTPEPEFVHHFGNQDIPAETHEDKLKAHRQLKNKMTKKAIEATPPFEEQELVDFYRALVKAGVQAGESGEVDLPRIEAGSSTVRKRLGREAREVVLHDLEERLRDTLPDGKGVDMLIPVVKEDVAGAKGKYEGRAHVRIAKALAVVVQGSTSQRVIAGLSEKGKGKQVIRPQGLKLGLVSRTEWDALFEGFIRTRDARGAESLLDVMQQHGVTPDEDHVQQIVSLDAQAGRSEEVVRLTSDIKSSGLPIPEFSQEHLMTSLMVTSPPQTETAISYLRTCEQDGQPLSQAAYNVVLTHLALPTKSSLPNAHTRALAQDLFAHMRLVAHPTPTPQVYATMIKACADPREPQPERARDLWIEMTTEGNKVQPSRQEYDAIIRALSSTKKDYIEAFQIFREMIGKHRDATHIPFEDEGIEEKWSRYVPTVETFSALLEGTKRAGDLDRGRWILREMVRLVSTVWRPGGEVMQGPNGELMSSVFMTYAVWKPPVRRQEIKATGEEESEATADQREEGSESETLSLDVNLIDEIGGGNGDVQLGKGGVRPNKELFRPMTAADAIRESAAVFERLVLASDPPADVTPEEARLNGIFANVKMNTRLVNSYLMVQLAHAASLASAREVWDATWKSLEPRGVRPNGWSYLMILSHCSAGSRGGVDPSDRPDAFEWGKSIWKEYQTFSQAISHPTQTSNSTAISTATERSVVNVGGFSRWTAGLAERQVEKAWRAIIRIHALSSSLRTSVSLLKQFHSTYPPDDIVKTYAHRPDYKLALQMSDPSSTPEPDIPPHLLYPDLDILHQKLVMTEQYDEVALVKYIHMAYLSALQKRRRYRIKGAGKWMVTGRKFPEKKVRVALKDVDKSLLVEGGGGMKETVDEERKMFVKKVEEKELERLVVDEDDDFEVSMRHGEELGESWDEVGEKPTWKRLDEPGNGKSTARKSWGEIRQNSEARVSNRD